MRFRKTLAFLLLAMALVFALSAGEQQKPFTQQQASNMVRARLGDDSGELAPTVAFLRLRSPEGTLFRQGFGAGILSSSVPFYKPTGMSRQLHKSLREIAESRNRVCASRPLGKRVARNGINRHI